MEIDEDLSIKFANPDVLFEPDSTQLRESFKNILAEFLPEYTRIINDKNYTDKITEIRIE
jgi:outer membrane protein OmpA-like peptidoglycan-associated protein